MKNIWLLAKSNLRKSKGQTFSMFLLIMIISMLLNVGLVMFLGIGDFFNKRAEELSTAHFVAFLPENEPLEKHLDFLGGYPQVYETESGKILLGQGGFYIGNELAEGMSAFAWETTGQQMNPLTLIGESLPLTENAIYIPHFIFLGQGYSLGDDFRINFLETEFVFTVAGSTEETMFGSNTYRIWRFYISEQKYAEIEANFPESEHTLLSARMTDGWAALNAAYIAEFRGITAAHYDYFHNRVMIPMIPALLIVALAFILLIVSSIVIRFRISNDIEEGMVNIGVLKAVGYLSSQIIWSIITQFGLIAFIGGVVGILPSFIVLPIIINLLIEPILGLPWNPEFHSLIFISALTTILVMVLLFAWVTSRRITKLHPIIALRGGITTHSFKKNLLPLDKTRGPLQFLLASKQLLQNKKQAIMLTIIISGLTFSTIVALTMHYNVNVNMDAFVHTVIGDVPDVHIRLNDVEDDHEFREWAVNRPEVISVFGRGVSMVEVEDYIVQMIITEDFAYFSGYSLLNGRYPILDSEIVLDSITLYTMGKSVGDWVTVRGTEYEQEYIITGVVQLMGTFVGMINLDGVRRIEPDYAFTDLGMYITGERAETAAFIEIIKAEKGDLLARISSLHGFINNILGTMGNLFAAFGAAVLFVVASVVVLVLYLIIKTMIVRRKRELGIQKALGFTTFQLMNQIALNLTPIIIIGVIVGGLGGYLGFNTIFIAIVSGMGIASADLPVPINWVIGVSVGLVMLSYTVSMLIAWKIRKISAYLLVTE